MCGLPVNHVRRRLLAARMRAVLAVLIAVGGMPAAQVKAAMSADPMVLLHGSKSYDPALERRVVAALSDAKGTLPDSPYFAISDARRMEDWFLVSVVGLQRADASLGWKLEDAVWTGLVLLRNDGSAAVQGEAGFPALLQKLPDRLLHAPSKRDLTRSMTTAAAAGGYIFPWQAGSFMLYGALGVHDNGFNSIESGMVAVDMLSDGDEAAGHAPNRLLAAAAGTITYKCYDGTSTAVHVVGTASDFFYSHLSNNANLSVGNAFQQGQELGQMVPGTFSGNCGWTSQADNWFHVHWGFPNADLQVENWTLSLATGNWTDGTTTVAPGEGWIEAAGPAPATPPVDSDFDGDTASDLAYFRGSTSAWGVLQSSTGFSYESPRFFNWGQVGDVAVQGDYDGDGLNDPTIRKPPANGQSAAYSALLSSRGYDYGAPLIIPAGWPGLGDTPAPADYNGDGITDPAIFRASTGAWIIPLSPAFDSMQYASWGLSGDVAIGADVDGDNIADIGYYRPSTGMWGFLLSSQGYSYASPQYFSWGSSADLPVMKDYDGDGKADPAYVTPPANGQSAAYRILLSSTGYDFGQSLTFPAGWPGLGDVPAPQDYDGDGKADPGIWRSSSGVWIIPTSASGYSTYMYRGWGASGDQVMK